MHINKNSFLSYSLKLSLFLFSITVFSFLSLISTNSFAEDSITSDVTVSVPVSCSFTDDTTPGVHAATINPGTYEDEIGYTNFKVFCNDSGGFALYAIGYSNEEYGNTTLIGSGTGQTIATGIAQSGNTSNWAMMLVKDEDGYQPNNLVIESAPNVSGGADAPFSSYHTVPDTYTKVATYNASTDTTIGAKLQSTYAAYISSDQMADTYNGKVRYTLVHPSTAEAPGPATRVPVTEAQIASVLDIVSAGGNTPDQLVGALLSADIILHPNSLHPITHFCPTSSGVNTPWQYLQYKPEMIDDGVDCIQSELMPEIMQDYRAWLTIPNTSVDYPVYQGEDNDYYANHDRYGDTAIGGEIYLDAASSGNFSDEYSIIYGYGKKAGAMFGDLSQYSNASYLNTHQTGIIVSGDAIYDLTVFAVALADQSDTQVFEVGSRVPEVLSYLSSGNENILYYDSSLASSSDKIVALATSATINPSGQRLVVFAKMEVHNLLQLYLNDYEETYSGEPISAEFVFSGTNYYCDTVAYSLDDGQTWSEEPPTVSEPGVYEVLVRATSEFYGTAQGSATITITN